LALQELPNEAITAVQENKVMKRLFITGAALVLMAGTASAETGGCLKYGAGGAVAGHFVGQGHAVLGAAGGCAVGAYKRHEAKKADREAATAVGDQRNATGSPPSHQVGE
jgi:hypothetical protein